MDPIFIAAGALVVGAAVGFAYQNFAKTKHPQKSSFDKGKSTESDFHAKELIIEAKDEAYKIKSGAGYID